MHLLCLFLLGISNAAGAQPGDAFYGKLVTKIVRVAKSADTTRQLYCRNIADDRLTVYTIFDGVVSSATAYNLSGSKNQLYLISRSIDQHTTDSLKIDFNDAAYKVIINKHDTYTIFPAAYAHLKIDVQQKHRLTAIMDLLNDAIGDYPIADALPLFAFQPNVSKQVKQAYVVTQRTQSDLTDAWTCNYSYNQHGLLSTVSAIAGEEIRYTKKVQYNGLNPTRIATYLNMESRQTLKQNINFKPGNHRAIKWQDDNYETGKQRETISSVSLLVSDFGTINKIEPSFTEVVSWIKHKANIHQQKKHTD